MCGDTLRFKAPVVELRAGPSPDAMVVGYAGEGKELVVVEASAGWVGVRLPDNRVAWAELSEAVELVRAPAAITKKPAPKKKPALVEKAKEPAATEKKVPAGKEAAPEKRQEATGQRAAVETKKAPLPAAAVQEKAATKAQEEAVKEERKKGPAPQLIVDPRIEEASSRLARSYYLAAISIGFGAACLLVARRKNRNALVWFTLGLYFTVIALIIGLVKRKRQELTPMRLSTKIVSRAFIVIWFLAMGGFYFVGQNSVKDMQAVQEKVDLHLVQLHNGNYKAAYLNFSPEVRDGLPYKKFAEDNEKMYAEMGDLKRYQLEDSNIRYGDDPTMATYMGTFERGKLVLIFNMKKPGGLVGVLRPGGWAIESMRTNAPRGQ